MTVCYKRAAGFAAFLSILTLGGCGTPTGGTVIGKLKPIPPGSTEVVIKVNNASGVQGATNCSHFQGKDCYLDHELWQNGGHAAIRWMTTTDSDHVEMFRNSTGYPCEGGPKIMRKANQNANANQGDDTQWCVIQPSKCAGGTATLGGRKYCQFTYDITVAGTTIDPDVYVDDGSSSRPPEPEQLKRPGNGSKK